LRKGNSGAAVLTLQTALNVAGTNPKLTEDGVFDNATVTALKNFQKIKNLTVDGIAGPEVFAALNLKV
jgi:peptidoglycan hydrolase-like protein with peptidoglycan-binding domain